MTAETPDEAQRAEPALRVANLRYGLAWKAHRWQWAPEAFPVNVTMQGWTLDVSEHRITAEPAGTKFSDEGTAREGLEPQLDAWAAELAVVHDLPVEYWFLDAQLVPDAPLSANGRGEATLGAWDWIGLAESVQVTRIRAEVPAPTWTNRPSPIAHDAREYCLLPVRSRRRAEVDAAFWLHEAITKNWASDEKEAAARLNLSHNILNKMSKLSSRAYERKPGQGSGPRTPEEKELLRRMVELVVHRLHLYEVHKPVGDYLTVNQV